MHGDYQNSAERMILSYLEKRDKAGQYTVSFSEIFRHFKKVWSVGDLEKLLTRLHLAGKVEMRRKDGHYICQLSSGNSRGVRTRDFKCLVRSPNEARIQVGSVILVFTQNKDGSIHVEKCTPEGLHDDSLHVPRPKFLKALHLADYIMEQERRWQKTKTGNSIRGGLSLVEATEKVKSVTTSYGSECGYSTVNGLSCKRRVSKEGVRCSQHTREARQQRATKILKEIMIKVREQEEKEKQAGQLSIPF